MKNFKLYRKIILISSVLLAAAATISSFVMLGLHNAAIIAAFSTILCILVFAVDYMHNRYTDDLIEKLSLLIENLVEQQEKIVFPELDDSLLSRLQHQLLKLREILLVQNKMLDEEKNQIKSLISDISHQIKTPVAAAKAFSELISDNEINESERAEYTVILQQLLDKLTVLTNCMIKVSRLESGIIVMKPKKNSLNDIVFSAVKSVYTLAVKKNITITFDDCKEYYLNLDFNWTAEAIANVIDNAVKYTESNGKIDILISDYPSYVKLDIKDNGIGIKESEYTKIFSRFYRGRNSSGVDGVGIGLYLARKIINMQNGYIKVSSSENGSVFSFFLKK